MNTRCKRGDLAFIREGAFAGHFVTVVELDTDLLPDQLEVDGVWWLCECHGAVVDAFRNTLRPGDHAAIHDENLVPIRDPGDDAQDELLRPLPEEVTT